jgi:hypothetical protein
MGMGIRTFNWITNPMGMGTRTFNWIYGCGHSLLLLWRPETGASSAVGLQVAYGPLWHSTEP